MVVIRPRGSAIVLLDWSVFLLWFVVNCVRERSGEKKREKARQEGGKETHTKKNKRMDGWRKRERNRDKRQGERQGTRRSGVERRTMSKQPPKEEK